MCANRRSSRGVMLRCVLSSASAYWRVTDQVQGPEGTVAEEQGAGEQHGQLPDPKQLHRWTGSSARDLLDAISGLGRDSIDSVVVVVVVLVPSVVVLVDHRVSPAADYEPAVDREGRHEGDRQCERQAPPEQ